MILKVVNETDEGKYELIEFSPTMKDEELVGKILDEATILRPVGVEDDNEVELYEGDIVEFKHDGRLENTLRGELVCEGCLWLIVCENLSDGYVELNEYQENDGRYIWVDIKKIGNKYLKTNLLK